MFRPSDRLRVLLIATDPSSGARLADELSAVGYGVTPTAVPGEAVQLATTAAWDAILLDVAPLEHTLELVRSIHAADATLATIVLSPDTSAPAIRAGLDAGAYSWIRTPAPFELVEAALLRAHERRQLRRPRATPPGTLAISTADVHLINNQLAGIIGLAQLHLIDDDLPSELYDDLTMMMQSARTIADMLKQIRGAQLAEPT